MLIVISMLFAVCFTGLAYVALKAVSSGAESYSGTYSQNTARDFEDLFLFIPSRRIAELAWSVAGAVFIFTFLLAGSLTSIRGFLVGLVIAAIAGGLALFSPRLLLKHLKQRRLLKFNLQLVDTLVNMSNALKAGFSITQAFEAVVKDGENPIAQEFSLFLHQTRVGVPFSEALQNLDDRVGSLDLTLVARAIETSRRTGGNLTEVFDKIASTIRERMRIENRIRTLTAQGRLQGIIVGSMPAILALVLLIMDPQMMKPFLASATGVSLVALAAVLVLLGALTIRKIIKIDV